ncbi:MAG: laccase domain-containing protein, partial [Planctomycetota bacterium]
EVAGGDAGEVVAAIGPGIGVDKFEVGDEVAERFSEAGLGAAVHAGRAGWGERPHVDLAGAVRARLHEAGVGDEAIDAAEPGALGACTYEQAEWFFSYRRDVTHGGAARTGHMAAVIGAGG